MDAFGISQSAYLSARRREHVARIISGTITTTLYRQWLDREEVRCAVEARFGSWGRQ